MNLKISRILLATLIAGLSCIAVAMPKPEQNLAETPNLEEQKDSFFDQYLLKRNTDYSQYPKVYIEPVHIEFDDRWDKDFRMKVSSSYKEYVYKAYSKLMKEQLEKSFSESEKFQLVSNKEEANMVLTPQIVNLYINGPEFTNNTKTYVNHVGRAKLNLLIVDAKGEALAKLIDQRETRDIAFMNELRKADRVRNYRDFKFLMKRWSKETVALMN